MSYQSINKRPAAQAAKRWKEWMMALFFAVATIAGIGLTGCRKVQADLSHYQPSVDTKTDTLRMFNLLYDSSDLDYSSTGYVLYINDSADLFVGRGLGYNNSVAIYGIPPALAIPAEGGTFTFKVASYLKKGATPPSHPDPSRILCQTTINVPAHSGFGNVFFYDSAGKPTIHYTPVTTADPGAPAPGTFKVRVVNYGYYLDDNLDYGGYDFPNSSGQKYDVQLQTADSAAVKGDEKIAFGTTSAYTEYGYGTFQFLLYNLTAQSYFNNSGVLNDIGGSFDLSTAFSSSSYQNTATGAYNYVYPNWQSNNAFQATTPTLHIGNIGSYPFSAGGCYTILLIGNMYAVTLDRQYGPGSLDNYGKVQLVNAAPGQTDLQVSIAAGAHNTQIASLPFGSASDPIVVPAEQNVTCTFSSHGQTLYTYSIQVPRLANYLLCYSTDLKNIPLVFPYVVPLDPADYFVGAQGSYPTVELNKVSFLDLCPDAGNVYMTTFLPFSGGAETRPIAAIGNQELPYKGSQTFDYQDGNYPASQFNLRLSALRTDSLASDLVATLPQPFPVLPSPGSFTIVSAGLLEATDPSQAIRLILVRNTNSIPKAQ